MIMIIVLTTKSTMNPTIFQTMTTLKVKKSFKAMDRFTQIPINSFSLVSKGKESVVKLKDINFKLSMALKNRIKNPNTSSSAQ